MTRLEPDDTLNQRFHLVRLLGKGGMGEVWLAEDRESGGRVAVKVVTGEASADPRIVELLTHEFRQARRLQHANIVRVFGFHQDDGVSFLSMEYVEGGDFGSLRRRSPEVVLRRTLPLIDAIAYAHSRGVIHRDLKPSNVLVDGSGSPRLADFGIAAAADALQPAGGGSRHGASPEQLAGHPPAPSDDVYGLGALIFELITGWPPDIKSGGTPGELPRPITDAEGTALPDSLEQLLRDMLAPAAARPQDVTSLVPRFEQALHDCRRRREADVRGKAAEATATITPVRRRGDAAGAPEAAEPRQKSAMAAWGAFAVLVMALVAVVFLLPSWVEEKKETAPAAEVPTAPTPQTNPAVEALAALRTEAEELRAEVSAAIETLTGQAVEKWGGATYQAAVDENDAAVAAWEATEFRSARDGWRSALDRLEKLLGDRARVEREALEAGELALSRGDGAAAEASFQLAFDLNEVSEQAKLGLQRAATVEQVFALMADGRVAELGGELEAARDLYEQAAELDSYYEAAPEAVARVDAAIVERGYTERMSRGFAALGDGRFEAARKAFMSARRIRPGSREAQDGIVRAENGIRLAAIQGHRKAAEKAAKEERWRDAMAGYRAALEVDATLAFAQAGLGEAEGRAALDDRLMEVIRRPDRLAAPAIFRDARSTLAQARAVPAPGPRLANQARQVEQLLVLADTPVPVVLQSDNVTEVMLYRVGKLGTFDRHQLELKPGTYVAVGVRDGFRDVRQQFTVRPGEGAGPVVVRCEEPI